MSDDAALYRAWLAARDEQAFAALARRHANLVVDVALRSGADRAEAEDALQEALLALACDGSARPADVGVRAWLARAALTRVRHAQASRRARARRERIVGAARGEVAMDPGGSEAAQAVRAALARLEGEQAALLSLRFLHGFEYAELAAAFDVAEPAARVRVHRALERLRTEARRETLDERAVGAALAGLPCATVGTAVVEGAIAAATQGALAAALLPSAAAALATAATAAAPAPAAVVSPLVLVGTIGALLLAGGAWWWFAGGRGGDAAHSTTHARADTSSPAGTGASVTLAGKPAREATEEPTDPAALPAAPGAPGKGAPSPRPAGARAEGAPTRTPGTSIQVRVELAHVDGSVEEIPVQSIYRWGEEWPGEPIRQGKVELRVQAGSTLVLSLADPRAAVARLVVAVPDPVPPLLVARVPAKGDPRLGRLTLEVVDSETGKPLPDAVLDWGEGAMGQGSVPADAQGRIVVTRSGAVASDAAAQDAALPRFYASERYVHAPGHWGDAEPRAWDLATAVDVKVLDRWLETGELRIRLERLPPVPGLESRWVRVLEADGRPAEGVRVYITFPIESAGRAMVHRAFRGWHDGFRRVGADGLVRVPVKDAVGLSVRRANGQPLGVWGFAKESWPEQGPRELRLPESTTLELTLDGVPEGAQAMWLRDPLGARRTPSDPSLPPLLGDEATLRILKEREAVFVDLGPYDHGPVSAPRSTVSIPLVVGRTETIYLTAGGERRALEVRADSARPLVLTRAWAHLAREGEAEPPEDGR